MSAFALFCQFDRVFLKNLLSNYPEFLSRHLGLFQEALFHPIESAVSQQQTALSYLVVDAEGVETFGHALALAPATLMYDPEATARALIIPPGSAVNPKVAAIDRILLDSGYVFTRLRRDLVIQVMCCNSLLLHWLIKLNSDKVLDVFEKLFQKTSEDVFVSVSLSALFLADLEGEVLSGSSVFSWYMQSERGIKFLSLLLSRSPRFLEGKEPQLREMLDFQVAGGEYLIAKMCATLVGRLLFKQIIDNTHQLFNESTAKRFQHVLFSEQEFLGARRTLVEILAYPELDVDYEGTKHFGLLCQLIIKGSFISEVGLQQWAAELSLARPDRDGSVYSIIGILNRYQGGRIFLVRFVQRYPEMIIWLLTHDFDNAMYLFSEIKGDTLSAIFSKIHKDKQQAYYACLGAAICQEVGGGEVSSVFFRWVMNTQGRGVLLRMMQKAPEIINENKAGFSVALTKTYGVSMTYSSLSWMLMNREGYVILWEFFVRFPDVIEHDLDAVIEALCVPTSAVRMTGLAAMVIVEGGLELLLHMLKFYPLLQTNGEKIIQTLLEGIINEKRQKSWVPMLELFHNPRDSKLLFHLYYYHGELMEQYVVKISELLVHNSSVTQLNGGALYQIIADPEDELSGNSALLALSRNFSISTLRYHLPQSSALFFEGSTDAVAQAIGQVVTGSVGKGESTLGWMARNNELCGILLSMVSYMST